MATQGYGGSFGKPHLIFPMADKGTTLKLKATSMCFTSDASKHIQARGSAALALPQCHNTFFI